MHKQIFFKAWKQDKKNCFLSQQVTWTSKNYHYLSEIASATWQHLVSVVQMRETKSQDFWMRRKTKTIFTKLNTEDSQKKRLTMIICKYKKVEANSNFYFKLIFFNFLALMKTIATLLILIFLSTRMMSRWAIMMMMHQSVERKSLPEATKNQPSPQKNCWARKKRSSSPRRSLLKNDLWMLGRRCAKQPRPSRQQRSID